MTKVVRRKRDTPLSKESDDGLWQGMIDKIGGREGLLRAAIASVGGPAGEKAQVLAELLLDPAFKGSGTKKLAQRAGLSMPEIVDLFRNAKFLEATIRLHEKLPDIVGGAAYDAAPSDEPCAECRGKGTLDNEVCWVCRGEGVTRRPGDKDKLKFVGESVGLLKGGGSSIQTNLQVNVQQPTGISFEDLVRRASVSIKAKQIPAGDINVERTDTSELQKTRK